MVEVISLHCLDRKPRPGFEHNRWVAEVMLEIPPASVKNGITSMKRTATVIAKDELAAFIKITTEGV